MANLVIDIGNTQIKVAVFNNDQMLFTQHYTEITTQDLNLILNDYPAAKAIISTVKKVKQQWQQDLEGMTIVTYFDKTFTAGITNHYATPQTLGADRLAAVIGAHQLYPDTDNLVIDAGTAITYDWVDAGGNYFGGSISPGINMRYKALNYYTDGLPLVEQDISFTATYGNSTKTAIQSGVQNGVKYEVEGFIQRYTEPGKALNIILTGGDGEFFDTVLKNSIFAPCIKIEPHLVLKGLNAAIQKHNDD